MRRNTIKKRECNSSERTFPLLKNSPEYWRATFVTRRGDKARRSPTRKSPRAARKRRPKRRKKRKPREDAPQSATKKAKERESEAPEKNPAEGFKTLKRALKASHYFNEADR
ncbi:hypothetical protein ACROYT_G006221 [Oculina patagonica]